MARTEAPLWDAEEGESRWLSKLAHLEQRLKHLSLPSSSELVSSTGTYVTSASNDLEERGGREGGREGREGGREGGRERERERLREKTQEAVQRRWQAPRAGRSQLGTFLGQGGQV